VNDSGGSRNILFVLYGDFLSNSAIHVHSLARELTALGHECAVAVPHGKETAKQFSSPGFVPLLFDDLEGGRFTFSDGRGPDIVHAWTPREEVRRFCQRLSALYSFKQFVHMEDNEWHLLARLTGRPLDEIQKLTLDQLDNFVPRSLSHPVRGAEFMKKSAGVTLIMDRLGEIIPPAVPSEVLWPASQSELFFPRPLPKLDGRALGIPSENTVIVYCGNVHPANSSEVRSLYLAIAILNREGFPATLVRTGEDYCDFLGPSPEWARINSVELGRLPRSLVPAVMALADIFVQPGKPDAFNDFRFPSKLPEFLSIGRPVIVPASNIGLHMQHGVDAWVLQEANGIEIADAIRKITGEPELYRTLASGALAFYQERLDWSLSARKLVDFYSQSAPQRTRVQAAG
jgi:glycosyltransferase involved in cell wall biosynthesis